MLADVPAPGSLFRFNGGGIYLPVGLAEPRGVADGRTRSVALHLGSDGTTADGAYVDVYPYVYLGTDRHGEMWSPTW